MTTRCVSGSLLLLVGIGTGVMACSLSAVDFARCQANFQCRDAFGWGHVCTSDGLCGPLTPHPRCRTTIPDDLLQDLQANADRIIIGSVYDDVAFRLEVESIELAIRQVNDASGLDGQPFGFVHCTNVEGDVDALDQETANLEMARYLANSIGVPAIVGPASSGRTEAAFIAIDEFDTLMISPSATSPALNALDGLSHSDERPGRLWRTAPPDSLQGTAIAVDMAQRGIERATVIHQSGPYGEGLAEAFSTAFGGEVELFSFSNPSVRDDRTVDAGVRETDEVLFISSEKSDITAFLNAVGNNPDFDGVNLFLTDGAFDRSVFDQATEANDRFAAIRGSRPAPADTDSLTYKAFVSAFSSTFGESPETSGFTPYAFDASWLVLYGAAWSQLQTGEVTGTGIAQGLRRLSNAGFGEPLPVRSTSWPSVVANFSAGAAIDVEGASGALDYDPQTEETVSPIDLWTIDASTLELVTLCRLSPGRESEAACPAWN